MNETPQDPHLTRRTLLDRLRRWTDQEGWTEFHDRYYPLILAQARRKGLGEEDALDVAQETLIAAAKSLQTFHYDPAKGSFRSWLLRLTHCRIADSIRRRLVQEKRFPSGETAGDLSEVENVVDSGAEPSEEWNRAWAENLREMAEARVRARADAKSYQVYDLVTHQGLSTAATAKAMRVTQAHVYLIKHRMIKKVRDELKQLKARLGD